MPRKAKDPKETVPSILDSFDFIGQADKNKFTKIAEGYGISQEKLLELAVKAANAKKLPIKTTITVIAELELGDVE